MSSGSDDKAELLLLVNGNNVPLEISDPASLSDNTIATTEPTKTTTATTTTTTTVFSHTYTLSKSLKHHVESHRYKGDWGRGSHRSSGGGGGSIVDENFALVGAKVPSIEEHGRGVRYLHPRKSKDEKKEEPLDEPEEGTSGGAAGTSSSSSSSWPSLVPPPPPAEIYSCSPNDGSFIGQLLQPRAIKKRKVSPSNICAPAAAGEERGGDITSSSSLVTTTTTTSSSSSSLCSSLPLPRFQTTEYTIANIDTLSAALSLGNDTVALSFANASTPGGYYLVGAIAQEEDLCRLLPQLYPSIANCEGGYPIPPEAALLSRNMLAVRHPGSYQLSVDHPLGLVSIITAAMPCGMADRRPKGGWLTGEWADTVRLRIRAVLFTAIASGHSNLVLGAFGCGAFGNPAKHVAALFKEQLSCREFRGHFSKIVFAIIDPVGTGNLKPFAEELKGLQ